MSLVDFLMSEKALGAKGIWVHYQNPDFFAIGDKEGIIDFGGTSNQINYREFIWFAKEAFLPPDRTLFDRFSEILWYYEAISTSSEDWPEKVSITVKERGEFEIDPKLLLKEYRFWKNSEKTVKTSEYLLTAIDKELSIMQQKERMEAIAVFLNETLPTYLGFALQ
ncbi:MAG: hypothetical protein F6K35_19055 [Okeania sp. SIO2H7]|nr:hypothetical protein [Okeania sp. SIO2H7]